MLTKDSFSLTHIFFYATKHWKTRKTIFTQDFPSKQTKRYSNETSQSYDLFVLTLSFSKK